MRFHLVSLFFITLLSVVSLPAQPASIPLLPGKITGKVVDSQTNAPLGYATVSLFLQKDSALVTGAITNDAGNFTLEADEGVYFATIEFLSFQAKTIENITISKDNPHVNLGTIVLEPEARTLNEVVVQAEKSTMQLSLDKKIFNVGKDLSNAGGSALDILDNIPSLTVDVEGNVSLRGTGNVRILIDGKPSGLVSFNGSDGLRQLPANMIERVEIITNPSARYEAEGMAGIINVILKKERRNGLNGSFDLSAGHPHSFSAGINLNYRRNRLNLFTNYGISYRKRPGTSSLYQEVYSNDTTFITLQQRDRERGGLNNNFRFGADYLLNDKNILTTAFSYRYGNDDNFSEIEYRDYLNSLQNRTGITTRREDEKETEPNYEYSLNYKKLFAREGHELVADFRYQDNSEVEKSEIIEHRFDGNMVPTDDPVLEQRSENRESEKQLIGSLDYVQPFAEEGKFEAGLRTSLRDIDNDYLVEEFSDGIWEPLTDVSNNLIYDENIHAAYAIFGNKVNRFSFQMGLRAELSDVRTELQKTSEVNDRTYLDFFPSTHFTYDISEQDAVQISYSRRLRRPRFWDLNPFFTFSDDRNRFGGNPNLDPEYTNSFEIGHIKYWQEGSLSSSLYYRHTTGKIERISVYVEDGDYFKTQPQNLSTEDSYGAEFTATFTPYKWWKLDGNLNFFRSETDGGNLGESYRSDTYSWFGRLTSRFTFWKKTDLQLRGNYEAPRETTQGRNKAQYTLDIALSKDILKNNGTLTLNVRDAFNSRRWRSITEGENFYSEGNFQWRSRQIVLAFNYRLNQKKQRPDREGGGEFEGGEGGDFN